MISHGFIVKIACLTLMLTTVTSIIWIINRQFSSIASTRLIRNHIVFLIRNSFTSSAWIWLLIFWALTIKWSKMKSYPKRSSNKSTTSGKTCIINMKRKLRNRMGANSLKFNRKWSLKSELLLQIKLLIWLSLDSKNWLLEYSVLTYWYVKQVFNE